MKIYAILLTLFFSINAHSEILGEWSHLSDNNKNSYKITITKKNNSYQMKYIFIYSFGNKINESLGKTPNIPLIYLGYNCYISTINDIFLEEQAHSVLCDNDNNMIFTKISNLDGTPYIPNYVVFKKIKN